MREETYAGRVEALLIIHNHIHVRIKKMGQTDKWIDTRPLLYTYWYGCGQHNNLKLNNECDMSSKNLKFFYLLRQKLTIILDQCDD